MEVSASTSCRADGVPLMMCQQSSLQYRSDIRIIASASSFVCC